MRDLVGRGDPSVRALSVIGLGRARHRASGELLDELLRTDRSVYVQAAAAWALGRLGDSAHTAALVTALREHAGVVSIAAASALGRLGDVRAREALARAVFDADPELRDAAARALASLGSGSERRVEELPVIDGALPVASYVALLVSQTDAPPEGAIDLAAIRPLLASAAREALRGPLERVAAALLVLASADAPHVTIGSLTGDLDSWPEAARAEAREQLDALGTDLLDELVAVSHHPDPSVRAAAVGVLARIDRPEAATALVASLEDDERSVQRAVLSALGRYHPSTSPEATRHVGALLRNHPDWATRTLAAETLARLGQPEGRTALIEALRRDGYAFVREAAARALGRLGGEEAVAALNEAASADPEPRVREAARAAARGERP